MGEALERQHDFDRIPTYTKWSSWHTQYYTKWRLGPLNMRRTLRKDHLLFCHWSTASVSNEQSLPYAFLLGIESKNIKERNAFLLSTFQSVLGPESWSRNQNAGNQWRTRWKDIKTHRSRIFCQLVSLRTRMIVAARKRASSPSAWLHLDILIQRHWNYKCNVKLIMNINLELAIDRLAKSALWLKRVAALKQNGSAISTILYLSRHLINSVSKKKDNVRRVWKDIVINRLRLSKVCCVWVCCLMVDGWCMCVGCFLIHSLCLPSRFHLSHCICSFTKWKATSGNLVISL